MIALPHSDAAVRQDPDHDAKLVAVREARTAVENDGVIAHAEMMAWFRSLGTSRELPQPKPCK